MKKPKPLASSSALTLHGSQWAATSYAAVRAAMTAPLFVPPHDDAERLRTAHARAVYLLSHQTLVTVGPR